MYRARVLCACVKEDGHSKPPILPSTAAGFRQLTDEEMGTRHTGEDTLSVSFLKSPNFSSTSTSPSTLRSPFEIATDA